MAKHESKRALFDKFMTAGKLREWLFFKYLQTLDENSSEAAYYEQLMELVVIAVESIGCNEDDAEVLALEQFLR